MRPLVVQNEQGNLKAGEQDEDEWSAADERGHPVDVRLLWQRWLQTVVPLQIPGEQ